MIETPSQNPAPTIIFAGSFLDHSARILEALIASPFVTVQGVLTTPPQPSGRTKTLTPTPVHQVALAHQVPVCTPSTLNETSLAELEKSCGRPELLVTAGYGKLVPAEWLAFPSLAALNLHFSLLPGYRGANPAEWAILRGETESGVTLIEMSPTFDTGTMVAQAAIRWDSRVTRESAYQQLYDLGADVLPAMLATYTRYTKTVEPVPTDQPTIKYFLPPIAQGSSPTPYAQRLVRDDGFIAWTALKDGMAGGTAAIEDLSPKLGEILQTTEFKLDAVFIERAIRALTGFPGVWTMVETPKGLRRLKILSAHLDGGQLVLDQVQLEGQAATQWTQVKSSVLG